MAVIFIMIPATLLLVALAIRAFVWAVNHDQFEDMETTALRAVLDNDGDPTGQPVSDPQASD